MRDKLSRNEDFHRIVFLTRFKSLENEVTVRPKHESKTEANFVLKSGISFVSTEMLMPNPANVLSLGTSHALQTEL